jgi:hypothetical protein
MLGYNWRHTFETHVVYGPAPTTIPDEWDVINWDGSIQAWTRTNSFAPLVTRDGHYQGELTNAAASADVQWTTPSRVVYLFHDTGDDEYPQVAGRLVQINDFNANTVQVQWNWNGGYITNVVDSAGGNYQFNYDSKRQLLTNVTFAAWEVNFTYDSTNRLISKSLTNTAGIYATAATTWQFQYGADGLLAQIIDPRPLEGLESERPGHALAGPPAQSPRRMATGVPGRRVAHSSRRREARPTGARENRAGIRFLTVRDLSRSAAFPCWNRQHTLRSRRASAGA